MPNTKIISITLLAMFAFSANSLLCRAALSETTIDASSFTTIRLVSGAIMLAVLSWQRNRTYPTEGSWAGGLSLFLYAAGFSYAYMALPTGTGALLLFGAVQVTMIGFGFAKGERLNWKQTLGFLFAFAGLLWLLAPGVHSPPIIGSVLMLIAGVAWGAYSLLGRSNQKPLETTAGNFVRSLPFALLLSLLFIQQTSLDARGIGLAIASGIGYALWYTALPMLRSTYAATLQLSVPVLAAISGIALLNETLSTQLILASTAVLGGIALFILAGHSTTKKGKPRH
ncbi:DMT family transporter [Teredinibacter franksiae]|uniref:DMT family transporter n=1 Tax=Teredinibacter franksiae TaxID=2761453 RepID=UPI001624C80E|nr:DMT family transporter [Teredinibacter franksiae]